MNRRAQTFSLVHLVEVILGLLVIVIIGVGLVSMIDGTIFLQKCYVKDNAYVLESLNGIPNGDVDYGYLWASPDYTIGFEKHTVTVQKTTSKLLKTSPVATKEFGTGEKITLTPITIIPKYYQFSTRGTIPRTITITPRVNLPTCPAGPEMTGISRPVHGDESNSISSLMTANLIERVNKERTGVAEGASVAIVFQTQANPEMVVYNAKITDATKRLACAIQLGARRSGVSIIEDSDANRGVDLKSIDADIIILVRGNVDQRETYTNALVDGVLEYWKTTPADASAPAQDAPPNAASTVLPSTSATDALVRGLRG